VDVFVRALSLAQRTSMRTVLQARVDNPELSLAELGELCGKTRDSVSSTLRRARELVEAS
jgi:DNA-binding transcriptional regulator WhiA